MNPTPPSDDAGADVRRTYSTYCSHKPRGRNDILANREVLWQALAIEESIIRAIGATGLRPFLARLLYVGCGGGGQIPVFLHVGFPMSNIHGLDILPERIAQARRTFPGMDLSVGDAQNLAYPDDHFDLVFESTLFIQMLDEDLASRVAGQMLRVCKPGRYVMLSDWRYSKPCNPDYRGLSNKRIRRLFDVPGRCEVVGRFPGALIPPVGRLLSKRCPSLYLLTRRVFPFLAGHRTVLLRKVG